MLPIVQAPNPVLSKVAEPIKKVDAEVKKLISEMSATLESTKDPEGVGLAAPQIGRSLQLFIVKESPDANLKVFINPRILAMDEIIVEKTEKGKKKKKRPVQLEGCLSLKDIWGVVDRSLLVTIEYINEDGKKITETFTDFLATIMQHETDHLHGILFPKHVIAQGHKLYKTSKEDGETVFEELEI